MKKPIQITPLALILFSGIQKRAENMASALGYDYDTSLKQCIIKLSGGTYKTREACQTAVASGLDLRNLSEGEIDTLSALQQAINNNPSLLAVNEDVTNAIKEQSEKKKSGFWNSLLEWLHTEQGQKTVSKMFGEQLAPDFDMPKENSSAVSPILIAIGLLAVIGILGGIMFAIMRSKPAK